MEEDRGGEVRLSLRALFMEMVNVTLPRVQICTALLSHLLYYISCSGKGSQLFAIEKDLPILSQGLTSHL